MSNYSNILAAPAGFKGVLSAAKAAEAIRDGIISACPNAEVSLFPMADGGMGTVEVVNRSLGGRVRTVEVTGPLGGIVEAGYLIAEECSGGPLWPPCFAPSKSAIIEMSAAAGWSLVAEGRRDPLRSTTRGVGQMIVDAIGQGVKKIFIGLGDSATIDFGLGMAAELGVVFMDDDWNRIDPIPINFGQIDKIDVSGLKSEIRDIEFAGLADVKNPAVGPDGAVKVFGPQKGLTPGLESELEADFERMIGLIEDESGIGLRDDPMTGSAGGLGVAVRALLNGSLSSGAKTVAGMIGLEKAIREAELVITGEGKFDRQSSFGKAPSVVSSLAVRNGKPCWIVAGRIDDEEIVKSCGIDKFVEVSHDSVPAGSEEAYRLIRSAAASFFIS